MIARTHILTLSFIAISSVASLAADYSISFTVENFGAGLHNVGYHLYTPDGRRAVGASSVQSAYVGDLDENGTDEYTYTIEFTGVAPGSYSVAMVGSTDSTYWVPVHTWTDVYDFTSGSPTPAGNPFTRSEPPLASNEGEVIAGNLDLGGNLFNFGTVAGNGEPGVQFTYNDSLSVFDTYLPRSSSPYNPIIPSAFTWSFPQVWNNTDSTPTMRLYSSGELILRDSSDGSIAIDPANQMITINGEPVLKGSTLADGALTRLKGGGATSVAENSIAFGSGAESSGYSSSAFGPGASANSFGMAAFGRFNLTPSASTSAWVGTDDLFVIGNGSSSAARSNAVTIKKNGSAHLHGSVTLGSASTGSLLFQGGTGMREISVGNATAGTDLRIAAGAANSHFYWGGALILSGGGVPASGNTGSNIQFQTASSFDGPQPKTRMMINRTGAVGIGSGSLNGAYFEHFGGLDIAWGGIPGTLVLGADLNKATRTNGQIKYATIVAAPFIGTGQDAHYTPMIVYTEVAEHVSNLHIGGGAGSAFTDLKFYTAPTTNSGATGDARMRLSINRHGGIAAGVGTIATSDATEAQSQFVVGKYNNLNPSGENGTNHTEGTFVVGSGGSEGTRKNALRVSKTGVVLIQASGDISMGEFTGGERP